MKKWTFALLWLMLFVTVHAANAQVKVVDAYVYGSGAKRTATFSTGPQVVGTYFAVQNLPASSAWKLSYYNPGGALVSSTNGLYNNPAPQPGQTTTLATFVPRGLVLTAGDWHIQLAINGQQAKDLYFSAGLNPPVVYNSYTFGGGDYLTPKTTFDVGLNLIGVRAEYHNLPAGSWLRTRYQRPDGTIALDASLDLNNATSYSDAVSQVQYYVNLDQNGTWRVIYDLNDQPFVTKNFQVVESVTEAKLDIPEYGSDHNPNDALRVSLYVKGHSLGNLRLQGRLLIDEKPFDVLNFSIDLSSGNWQRYLLNSIPSALIQGKHTIRVAIDGPNALSSGKITSAVSGFNLLQHSFRFKNYTSPAPLAWNGVCVGIARLSNYDFMKGIPIPSDFPNPSRSTASQVYTTFVGGNAWLSATVVNGGNGWKRLQSYSTDDDAIASESDRIHNHLQNLQSWVVITSEDRSKHSSHAVVATAEFYCENPYIVGFENDNYNTRLFSVYDSNMDYGEYGYIAIFENTAKANGSGRFSMTFPRYPNYHFPFEFSEDSY